MWASVPMYAGPILPEEDIPKHFYRRLSRSPGSCGRIYANDELMLLKILVMASET